ncbi:uncharacterized protein LACBIDRAFT_302632 [Laccaria bicolor S238N-H82]|uniref:Predicted protein n=1 Tax=Laccaria bicolor (strain S238N-H82 / ATCC MYA-4686) TaxID=486041 RepID=B0DI14_LACBS|nr:uncharacterized protein LACBIDRAFT_302632 [Laccaria bicolor S238N-H82]EDR05927.1 predicted protein [Laccaria bicolor S238N-H82]|eukprot:XP_001883603.1 predicted protein [Laccaria bicolor S238N-H82]
MTSTLVGKLEALSTISEHEGLEDVKDLFPRSSQQYASFPWEECFFNACLLSIQRRHISKHRNMLPILLQLH